MANTTFVDYSQNTPIVAAWLNDVNNVVYNLLGDGTTAPPDRATALTNLGAASQSQITSLQTQINGKVDLTWANRQAVGGGSANAVTATFTPLMGTLVDGAPFEVKFPAANTGAVTLQIEGGAVIALRRLNDTALLANDIPSAGYWGLIYWSLATGHYHLVNPAPQTSSSTSIGVNVAVNAGFRVNQRVVSGTVTLAAGVYGHDGWRGGEATVYNPSGGCVYTFATSADGTVTITVVSGELVQRREGGQPGSTTFTLSWTGTAQGRCSSSDTYGASPHNATSTSAGFIDIYFNAGTVSNVKLEQGAVATPYTPRDAVSDLQLCQRWYQKSFDPTQAPAHNVAGGFSRCLSGLVAKAATANGTLMQVRFPVVMRAQPAITLYNPGNASPGTNYIRNNTTSTDIAVGTSSASPQSFGITNAGTTVALGDMLLVDWTADSSPV